MSDELPTGQVLPTMHSIVPLYQTLLFSMPDTKNQMKLVSRGINLLIEGI